MSLPRIAARIFVEKLARQDLERMADLVAASSMAA